VITAGRASVAAIWLSKSVCQDSDEGIAWARVSAYSFLLKQPLYCSRCYFVPNSH